MGRNPLRTGQGVADRINRAQAALAAHAAKLKDLKARLKEAKKSCKHPFIFRSPILVGAAVWETHSCRDCGRGLGMYERPA